MSKVSVLIPVYNCEGTLERSLKSVADQTYKDFEVVVVDNNCTDSSMDIVDSFKSMMGIRIVKCENQGIVPALNTGLRNCRSKYIARQDGDDYWYPQKLEKQIEFLEENDDIAILGTQIRLLDEAGNVEELGTFGKKVRYPTGDKDIKLGLLYGQNMFCHPTTVFRMNVIDSLGGYEDIFPLAEDLHMWLRALPHFKFANLPDVLLDYTQRKDPSYDARVPLLAADTYFNLYKAAGIVEGEREEMLWNWQMKPGGHHHES